MRKYPRLYDPEVPKTNRSGTSWAVMLAAGFWLQLSALTQQDQALAQIEPKAMSKAIPLPEEKIEALIKQTGSSVFKERETATIELQRQSDWPAVWKILQAQEHPDLEIAQRAKGIIKKNENRYAELFAPEFYLNDLPTGDKLPWMHFSQGFCMPKNFKHCEGKGYSFTGNYLKLATDAGAKNNGSPVWQDWKWATKFVLKDLTKAAFLDAIRTPDPKAFMTKKKGELKQLFDSKYKAEDEYKKENGLPPYPPRHQPQQWPRWQIPLFEQSSIPFLKRIDTQEAKIFLYEQKSRIRA